MTKNLGENISDGNFLGGNFPGGNPSGGIWLVGVFRVGVSLGDFPDSVKKKQKW